MKIFACYILMCAGVFLSSSFAGGTKKIGEDVFIQVERLESEIKIDGRLDEIIWQSTPINSFTQKDPEEGKPASERTDVWITYDHSAIYIAAKLYDSEPDKIIGHLARRDYYNESDWFTFYIDPYYDRQTGYFFSVNPEGSIMDGTMYNDSWNERSWNGIWEYAVNVDDKGWNVEMRIPFTQIRFKESNDMKWGVNLKREIQRKGEVSYFVMVPKQESGFVSHFATLEGLTGITSKQRIEILPYFVSKANFLLHNPNDPFYKSKQFGETFGADFKLGIGSNLTLDATVNPDFGQVEVDPAVVNLSAFESYFSEKRPFFIEGSNIFYFGSGGTNNNWSFNWGNPQIFYSRRIGRSPRGSVNTDGFIDAPSETRIIGAAKLTGKINGDWSVGLINATTERTFARSYNEGFIADQEIEPLTNYGIVRAKKEFDAGRYGLGFIGTSVIRDQNNSMNSLLSKHAFVYGTDGWITLDDKDTYVLKGYFTGSHVQGTEDYLIRLQKSPLRYYQRPDAKSYRLDSSLTSLSGYTTRLDFNKQKGDFYINAAYGMSSPGYEINDLGFQFRADMINSHVVLGYRWFNPDSLFRNKSVYFAHYRGFNYDGNETEHGYMLFSSFQLMNYYGFGFRAGYNPESYSVRMTRGGPLSRMPESYFFNTNVYSDSRKSIIFDLYSEWAFDVLRTQTMFLEGGITWKPDPKISLRVAPFFNRRNDALQWVGSFGDPFADFTYERRYVFAEIHQTTIGGSIRLDWTFTPSLSLQLYMQPLFAVGDYENYKEFAKPGTYETNTYGENGSEITANSDKSEYTVDPDGDGPAESFTFSNPDFNFKSIRANVVLRWEFLPGSVFYLVWTHDKTNFDNPGNLSFGRDFRNLWNTGSNNILLAKVSYWLNI